MSYDYDDEGLSVGDRARRIQKAIGSVPEQAQLVAKYTEQEGDKIRNEINRVVASARPIRRQQPRVVVTPAPTPEMRPTNANPPVAPLTVTPRRRMRSMPVKHIDFRQFAGIKSRKK